MQAWGIEQLVLALYVARVPKAGFGQILISNKLTKPEGEYYGLSLFPTKQYGCIFIYRDSGIGMMVQDVAICLLLLMWSHNLNVARAPWPVTPLHNHYINVKNIGLYRVSPLRDPFCHG